MDNLKDFKNAVKDFTKVIEMSKKDINPIYLVSRAESKYELEDYNGSISDCNQAILIDPKLINSYITRAKAKLMLGQKESACIDFTKAVSLGYIDETGIIKNNCK